jgi:hypothetical protein
VLPLLLLLPLLLPLPLPLPLLPLPIRKEVFLVIFWMPLPKSANEFKKSPKKSPKKYGEICKK